MIHNSSGLEKRLIDFVVFIIEIVADIPDTIAGNHLSEQLVRSTTATALNYGEPQKAESQEEFIRGIRVVLKEMRESLVCLKIILNAKTYKAKDKIESAIAEIDELISIFEKSIKTEQKKYIEGISYSEIEI